ncbi:putative leucine-rich repeat-containing protein DDB_G0290503 isoform X2 [Polistes fuscatus]|uniref:putative leucine-rich repeat-containing protein DDB_G0290503 isoform X2 n=1 Tax=Polistes fuscatus TaxID=30207 RepID=UPI001CA92CA8|nr:putative leucine-rich repeat-containing protein DDB_G0290503 isoform X2 [Polistes fuscatus]
MEKLIKDNQIPQILDIQNINEINDSIVDQDLSLIPMEIIENTNFVKLRDKSVRNESNRKNIYSCNQTEIIKSSEERQIVYFFNWRVMLDKKGHLIIVGTSDCRNFVRSQPINKRLTATNVESIFNNIYHLNGNLVDYWDELPDYIRFKFFNGFPEDWEKVTDIWKLFVMQGSNSNFHWPTFEHMKKGQTQNAFKFKVHSCTFCGQKCNGQILKVKNDNTIYKKTYLENSTDLPFSNIVQNVYNINNNSLDKENLQKYKNINDNQSPHLPKEKKMNNLKDKQNAIINNLLNKDVPKEHISKIIEIFDFDKNILLPKLECNVANSTEVQNNEVINNFERNYDVPLLTELTDSTKNNVEEMHRNSKIAVRENRHISTESEKINDMILQRSDEENAKRFESNAYAGKPRIISDKILSDKEVLVERYKRHYRRKKKLYNSTARSSRKFRKSMKNGRETQHFDLGFNNIQSNIKCHDYVDLSESTDTDERNGGNMMYKGFNKRKSNYFSNNSNSSMEEPKQKKHWNKTEVIERSVEIPEIVKRFVDTNQPDTINKASKNNTSNNDNQMMLLEQKQNITSEHLSIVKSPILENYYDTNANENTAIDKLESTPVLYNTKDINESEDQLTSDEEVGSDDEIYDSEYNTKNNHQISRGNDIQTESNKGPSLLELKKPKLLSDWIPQVIFDSTFTNGFSLVFEGQLLNDAGHVIKKKFITHPIHERLSATLIKDINQDIYQLIGNLHNSKHVVPKKLMKQCLHGCPLNINKFCKMWKSYKEGDTNKIVTRQENKITNKLNVTTSSRGRKIFPPLNYWIGERVVSKNKDTVCTTENIPKKRFKDVNTTPEMMEKKENMCESLNNLESSKISKQKKLPITLKRAEIRLYRCDLQLSNQRKVNKNNKKVSQSGKRSNNNKKKSSTKKINLKYTYKKNVPRKDDVLSDDQEF